MNSVATSVKTASVKTTKRPYSPTVNFRVKVFDSEEGINKWELIARPNKRLRDDCDAKDLDYAEVVTTEEGAEALEAYYDEYHEEIAAASRAGNLGIKAYFYDPASAEEIYDRMVRASAYAREIGADFPELPARESSDEAPPLTVFTNETRNGVMYTMAVNQSFGRGRLPF